MRAYLALALCLAACDDLGGGDNDPEVITTVTLSFQPMGGGAAIVASFDDPDGDGGAAPVIDPVNLVAGTTYTLNVQFLNKLVTPAEDITLEVRDEGDHHQVFFTGSAPVTHGYADMDIGGLPIGLTNTMVAAAGTGPLTVTLVHLPPVNGKATKVADLAARVKNEGIAAIGGETDAVATFTVTVP